MQPRAIRTRTRELQACSYSKLQLRWKSTTSTRTDFQANDAKWQAIWQRQRASRTAYSPKRQKKYVLPMFAYPSGSLHMGHLRVYTISDVLARFNRMKGFDVLHPTGWDAFGLPAENAAIERGIDPGTWTMSNIQKMKGQLMSMGTHFDWEHEISTCSPTFYKHTQKLFLMLYKSGLAYQAEALVNYDPVDQTVLANEQVDSTGRSWRSGAVVEQRMLRQWFFRITAFQEALLNDLDQLAEENRWPDRVVQQQRNWIGGSPGATIAFDARLPDDSRAPVHVFTTRPDTLYGVEYIALSTSHPIVLALAKLDDTLADFIAQDFDARSKAGYRLPVEAAHPLRSGSKSHVPVYVAPYVLEGYGEGAVMGVPAHDNRDLEFWKANSPDGEIPIVVVPGKNMKQATYARTAFLNEADEKPGFLTEQCGEFAGLSSEDAGQAIVEKLSCAGLAVSKRTWRLRDWLISRQRYWGTPIPIIHCKSCGAVPVPEEQLPVELPKLGNDIQGRKGNPLDGIESFVNTTCPSCGRPAKRETDTMDTFVDSSWYYARFPDSQNEHELFSHETAKRIMPVDIYIGGVEHAILHLLYARFIYKFLCKEGMIPSTESPLSTEPFQRLIAQGMVHGKTFRDPDNDRALKPEELIVSPSGGLPTVKRTGEKALMSFEKMSKSKHNGIDPLDCFRKYGADITRAHMLFAAPLSEVLQWDEEKIVGMKRWIHRLSVLVEGLLDMQEEKSHRNLAALSNEAAELLLKANDTLLSVTAKLEDDIYSINTVISDLIKLTNAIHAVGLTSLPGWLAEELIVTLIKMLAPIAPAFAEQCFEDINHTLSPFENGPTTRLSIFDHSWPELLVSEEEAAVLSSRQTTVICSVQINGKFRFTCDVPKKGEGQDSDKHNVEVVAAVMRSEQGKRWLKADDVQKLSADGNRHFIVRKEGRLVNILLKPSN